ncbi:MAG: uroporphyrinogen decarboxylase family protein [bacterium]|nr:uroporphyrinogen decarboxylase family protein [bacterium]
MRKPDKNRYLVALKHIESEEICFQESEIESSVVSKILGRPVPMNLRSYELPVKDYIELNLKCGNDMIFLANVWELGRKNVFDSQGRKQYVDGTIKTRADLKQIKFPCLDIIKKSIEELLEGIEGTGLGLIYTPNQTAFIVTTAIGYQDYYMYMITDPEFIHDFQKMVNDFCISELELALSYPIDVIQVGSVICSKEGPMFSREMIEEFEYPGLRQRVELAKNKELPVSIHFDGNGMSLISDFIEMGIDVLNPIEPCDGKQDIYKIKEMYGNKIALHGNIDLSGVLAFGTPEDVEKDVIEHIERLAVGGGYICASSHNITEAVPLENFYAMRDTVLRYRFKRK